MELDPKALKGREIYKILTGLVAPRPIALVTSVDKSGNINAAPFSFFNAFGSHPPLLAFAPGDKAPGVPKDTAANIKQAREFVVNLVDAAIAQQMHDTSAALVQGENELAFAGLTAQESVRVKAPRIKEAPVSFECSCWGVLEIGFNRMVIGVVEYMHVREGILDPETYYINKGAYKPVGRMQGPGWYCLTEDRFEMNISKPLPK